MARNGSPYSLSWLWPGFDSSPLRLLKSKIQPPLFRPLIIPAANHEGLLSRSNICTASNRGAEISPLGGAYDQGEAQWHSRTSTTTFLPGGPRRKPLFGHTLSCWV